MLSEVLSEFLRFLFQPPVLVLFCLAVAGLSMMFSDKSEYRHRTDLEWHVREGFYREYVGFDDDLIARARRQFYASKHLNPPLLKPKEVKR